MITHVEFKNYKSFATFQADLQRFQVLLGPNGSGKSNLFHGLQTLARVARYELEPYKGTEAFETLWPNEVTFPSGSMHTPFRYIAHNGDENLRVGLGASLKTNKAEGEYLISIGVQEDAVVLLREKLSWNDGEYVAKF